MDVKIWGVWLTLFVQHIVNWDLVLSLRHMTLKQSYTDVTMLASINAKWLETSYSDEMVRLYWCFIVFELQCFNSQPLVF